jgi:phage-related protein (TIGR01555 family)
MYEFDGYAHRIVDIVATSCTRKGWKVFDKSKDVDPMAGEDQRLDIRETFKDAIRIARIEGSGYIWMVLDEELPIDYMSSPSRWLSQPVDTKHILRVARLNVLDTFECTPATWDTDERSPNYRKPLLYTVSPQGGGSGKTGVLIHWTRIIKIDGDWLSPRQQYANMGRGASALQKCWNAIRNLNTVDEAGATHSQELSIPVLKVGNLDGRSSGDPVAFNLKTQIIAKSRSLLNMILIGSDDDYFNREISLSGFDKVAARAEAALSAQSTIPAIILHGDPPGGLGTDGESHRALWGNETSGYQDEYLTPGLTRVYTYCYLSRFGPTGGILPEKWAIIYHPLDELSEQGEAELRKTVAETDAIYAEMGVIVPKNVIESRFTERGFQVDMLPINNVTQTAVVTEPTDVDAGAPMPIAAPVSDRTYNGAQVDSALEIVTGVNSGTIPTKEQGIAMLSEFFNISKEVASAMIGGAASPSAAPAGTPGVPPVLDDAAAPLPTIGKAAHIPLRMQIPTGDVRRGISPDGTPWAVTMPCDYGEIPGTHGLDGEPVDYLLTRGGPRGMAFVAEQLLPSDGEPESELARADSSDQLDEYKVIFGCADINSAKALLEGVYTDTSSFGAIWPVPEESLLDWLRIRSERAPHIAFDAINMRPPDGVKEELKRGLEWHKEGKSGKGLVPATVAWARRLASGQPISPAKAVKMRAWLARHEVDKQGEGYKPGEDGFPSPGRVAWALWGGDAGVAWSGKLVGQLEAAKRK